MIKKATLGSKYGQFWLQKTSTAAAEMLTLRIQYAESSELHHRWRIFEIEKKNNQVFKLVLLNLNILGILPKHMVTDSFWRHTYVYNC